MIVGFNHHYLHKPKPTIKVNILYYEYNAIAAVVDHNPQSILVSFLITIANYKLLAWAAFSLQLQWDYGYVMYVHNLENMLSY